MELEFTAEQAYTRYVTRLDPSLGTDGLAAYVEDATIDLGYRYRSQAVVANDHDDGLLHENPHEPSGRPGTRAPHVELDDGSTLDLLGRDFVVLAAGMPWSAAASEAGIEARHVDAP